MNVNVPSTIGFGGSFSSVSDGTIKSANGFELSSSTLSFSLSECSSSMIINYKEYLFRYLTFLYLFKLVKEPVEDFNFQNIQFI